MTKKRKPMIAGNWKMNGLAESAELEIENLATRAMESKTLKATLVICPPATLLAPMHSWIKSAQAEEYLSLGAQDCHPEISGAFTGDLSAPMVKDAGALYVILGHSERRQYHHETDAYVMSKVKAAHQAKLIAIICVGETLEQRDAGSAEQIVEHQLGASLPDDATATNSVVAYEPVWAIGTGRTPSARDVAKMHDHIRAVLTARYSDGEAFRLLYGGSVKPGNAKELLNIPNVDGALVGGASLMAADFWDIAKEVV